MRDVNPSNHSLHAWGMVQHCQLSVTRMGYGTTLPTIRDNGWGALSAHCTGFYVSSPQGTHSPGHRALPATILPPPGQHQHMREKVIVHITGVALATLTTEDGEEFREDIARHLSALLRILKVRNALLIGLQHGQNSAHYWVAYVCCVCGYSRGCLVAAFVYRCLCGW